MGFVGAEKYSLSAGAYRSSCMLDRPAPGLDNAWLPKDPEAKQCAGSERISKGRVVAALVPVKAQNRGINIHAYAYHQRLQKFARCRTGGISNCMRMLSPVHAVLSVAIQEYPWVFHPCWHCVSESPSNTSQGFWAFTVQKIYSRLLNAWARLITTSGYCAEMLDSYNFNDYSIRLLSSFNMSVVSK